jgi:hypothetical protein
VAPEGLPVPTSFCALPSAEPEHDRCSPLPSVVRSTPSWRKMRVAAAIGDVQRRPFPSGQLEMPAGSVDNVVALAVVEQADLEVRRPRDRVATPV